MKLPGLKFYKTQKKEEQAQEQAQSEAQDPNKGKSPAVQIWSAVMKNVHSNLSKTTFNGISYEIFIPRKSGGKAASFAKRKGKRGMV